MASLVASVSWPRSVPTIRRRMGFGPSWYSAARGSAPLRLDHFGHRDAQLLFDQHDFTARDEAIVDVDVDCLADLAIELEHRTGAEPQQVADIHAGAAEHGRHLYRYVENRFKIRGTARGLAAIRHERGFIRSRHHLGIAVEFGKRNLGFVTHRSL